MSTLRALFVFIAVAFLAFSLPAFAEGISTASRSLTGVSGTTDQTAVYASFVASVSGGESTAGEATTADITTAFSVSNPLAWDPMSPFLDLSGYVTEGTLEVYLWDQAEGELVSYETTDNSVGFGLNEDGTLSPGGTWSFLLSDILTAVGWDADFVGFGWIVANFDGVAGTQTVTVFSVGFNQAFHLVPAVGQGVHGMAGLPVSVEP